MPTLPADRPTPEIKRWGLRLAGAGILLAVLGLACWLARGTAPPAPPAGPPWFADVTEAAGIDFVHDAGPTDGRYFMPQVVGSGCALFDCDGDGLLDILLLNNGGSNGRPNALYRQRADGRFEDVSKGSGLDFSGYCMGVAIGDVDNDGRPDVLITEYGRIRLLLNEGNGHFRDATRQAGLESPLWGTSAAFFDFDRDGWLDLVVVNYVDYDPSLPCPDAAGAADFCHPKVFQGTVAKLFRNVSARPGAGQLVPRFEDVTVASGLASRPGPGLGVVCADFTGDGWPDILVANDGHPNYLWVNRTDGTFAEEATARGLAHDGAGRPLANMGVALGDTHGTGQFDVFVSHLREETHTLWRQGPRGLFSDATAESGLLRSDWRATGFGTALADFDHDGRLDLALANGGVVRAGRPAAGSFWTPYAERNQLFAGTGPGRFRDASADNPDLCGTFNVARGLAVGDVDGDGALDLLVTCAGGRALLLRNVAPRRGHWLLVRAVDTPFGRDAYGAEVSVEAGGQRRTAWVNPGQSYLSSHDPRVHFGLAEATSFDALHVAWPDGSRERFPGGAADRLYVLRKGRGKALPREPVPGQGVAPR